MSTGTDGVASRSSRSHLPRHTDPVNWSSFLPDMIVAVSTGLLVGAGVLVAEIWFHRWRAAREVTAAQRAAVNQAGTLVFDRFDYSGGFHPAAGGLRRVRKLVRAVPPGTPNEVVAGYHYLDRMIHHWTHLEAHADAIDARLQAYQNRFPTAVHIIRASISEPASFGATWQRPDFEGYPPGAQEFLDQDESLASEVDLYWRERRLLEAYREAFVFAEMRWRWELSKRIYGGPSGWFAARRRTRQMRAAAVDADRRAYQLPLSVSGGYLDDHPLIPDVGEVSKWAPST